jgi:hypothetical protein
LTVSPLLLYNSCQSALMKYRLKWRGTGRVGANFHREEPPKGLRAIPDTEAPNVHPGVVVSIFVMPTVAAVIAQQEWPGNCRSKKSGTAEVNLSSLADERFFYLTINYGGW